MQKERVKMFIERIKEKYTTRDPIFTKEIMELFPEYSERHVYRLIKKAISDKELILFTRGIYAIPAETIFGTLIGTTTDDIAYKRYIKRDNDVFGIISGMMLLNVFHITTQVPAVWDIVTNNESTRSRKIVIDRRKFILHKSGVTINNENYAAYTVVQLFTDMDDTDKFDDYSGRALLNYVKKHNITKEQILSLVEYFPPKGTKRLLNSIMFKELP